MRRHLLTRAKKLETETFRVAEWLHDRAKSLLKPHQDVQSDQTKDTAPAAGAEGVDGHEAPPQQATPHPKPLHRRDVVLFALSPDGSYAGHYTLDQLATERRGKDEASLPSGLVGKILIVDARVGGLSDGVLDSKRGDDFPTADTDKDWSQNAGFRVQLGWPQPKITPANRTIGITRMISFSAQIATAMRQSGLSSSITGAPYSRKMLVLLPGPRS